VKSVDLTRGDQIELELVTRREAIDPDVAAKVAAICDDVAGRGDAALVELTRRFDGVDVEGRIRIGEAEMEAIADRVDPEIGGVLERLAGRLAAFCEEQRLRDWERVREGARFGERVRPIVAVGAYAPGGRAIYPSTVLMTTVPATVAGVPHIALGSPPTSNGDIAPLLLRAARTAGVDAVYRIGGAQAIAALAYGTESVERVDKIVGPGNVWVTAAKRHVASTVGIDALAGPSDATVLSDGRADEALVAAELVAQAEHDPDSRVYLVTTDGEHARRVLAEVDRQAVAMPRAAIVAEALDRSAIVVCGSLDEAIGVVDRLAPEHLLVLVDDPDAVLARCRAYGAAFLGSFTSIVVGDYGGTSNHTLPTMGTARFSSGLRTADFQVAAAYVEMTAEAVRVTAPDIEALARREGLDGHADAIARHRRLAEVEGW
jgi:histidinol dehydrogenase